MGCNDYNLHLDNSEGNESPTPEYNIYLDGVGVNGYSPTIDIVNENTASFQIQANDINGTELTSPIPKLSYLQGNYVSNTSLASTLANYSTTSEIASDYLKVDGSNADNLITINGIKIEPMTLTSINSSLYLQAGSGSIVLTPSNGRKVYYTPYNTSVSNKYEIATIGDIGNGTITLTQGGVTKGTFTTNQSGNTTINLDAGGGSITNPLEIEDTNSNNFISIGVDGSGANIRLGNTQGLSFNSYLIGNATAPLELTNGAFGDKIIKLNIDNTTLSVNSDNELTVIGGGGGTTYTAGTGIDITGNVISVDNTVAMKTDIPSLVGYIQNTATGSASLTISGVSSTGAYATNVGYNSEATATGQAFGHYAKASGSYSLALGQGATASGSYSIQLGKGTNSTANTLSIGFGSVGKYQLLDGTTGLIPDARISSNIARTSAIPDISNLISNTDYATTSTKGIVQPDGSTITVNNGVISATPARNIGEIVHSIVPLTDAELHLLDGSLIDGSGAYASFVQYIASFYGQEEAWTQPVLNSNGIMGGNRFAVSASSEYDSNYVAYYAFDGNTSTDWVTLGNSTPCYISFYSPTPIKVSQLTMTNRNNTAETFTGGTVYGSNDGVNWTSLTTYNNSVTTANAVWTISLSSNTNFYNYYKIEATSLYGTNCGFANIGITATQMKYPIFTDETSFQNMVSTYGVCGRFVYDNVNNTVRLPKITGIIEGTVDMTALGQLMQAGLPNITGTTGNGVWNFANGTQDGAIYIETAARTGAAGAGGVWDNMQIKFDASRSSSIYGNSSTVQPQTIKAFVYIVIATSTKTEIQVDIDEIATDLNGKADKDLSNLSSTGKKVIDGQWVSTSANNDWIILSRADAAGVYTIDLSSYLPNDNYNYLVWFSTYFAAKANTVSYSTLKTSLTPVNVRLAMAYNSPVWVSSVIPIPVGTDRTIYYDIQNGYDTGTGYLVMVGYRRIGTNS